MKNKTILLPINSDPAQIGPILRVAKLIAHNYGLRGHVIVPRNFSALSQSQPSVKLSKIEIEKEKNGLTLHYLPAQKGNIGRFGFETKSFKLLLQKVKPKYIWIYAEFWEGITRQVLWHYRINRYPRIISFIHSNHSPKASSLITWDWPFISRSRFTNLLLWPRLNGVYAIATKSMECAQRIGLPQKVPIIVNYLPAFGPDDASDVGISLPWKRSESFTAGFAGTLNEQKGWKVLLSAIKRLPDKFKVVLVGDGELRGELEEWIQKPELKGRAYYTGPLPKEELLASYPLFDVFVLPSLTMPHSVEQFGLVLAEAMACGVPVIGSDSGAIPETIGEAGLIVPEGDPEALAQTIQKLHADKEMHSSLVALGLKRYRTHYTCEVYAKSIANLLNVSQSTI